MNPTNHELVPVLHNDPPPLRVDTGGVIRIGTSRISLDLVMEQYQNGMTPEELVRAYDTLRLADVYSAIGYYFRHREESDSYLKRRAAEAEVLRAKIGAEGVRITHNELVERLQAREKGTCCDRGRDPGPSCGVSAE
jgi:uncharacterized protein (DUF433 family)